MSSAPEIETRAEQPYVAIRTQVTMQDLGTVVPPLNQEVFAWLGAHGAASAGAPFWKYNVIDMAGTLEIEAGAPVPAATAGRGMPAGRRGTAGVAGRTRRAARGGRPTARPWPDRWGSRRS